MNYKIFQICFTEEQLKEVDPLLTPFDNIENPRPEEREYYNFKKAWANEDGILDGLDAYGFFGPRWREKLRYGSKDIIYEIENNPGYDVYTFNHGRIVDALYFNVWEQGEFPHKGIIQVTKKALEMAGYDPNVLDELMFNQTTCYCSYFVATKEFWKDYLTFIDEIKHHLENLPEEEKRIYESSANYARDPNLNLFPFIVERLFSTYLVMNRQKLKVHAKSYDYNVYSGNLGEFVKVFEVLSNLKELTLKNNCNETFQQWNILRKYILDVQRNLINLD